MNAMPNTSARGLAISLWWTRAIGLLAVWELDEEESNAAGETTEGSAQRLDVKATSSNAVQLQRGGDSLIFGLFLVNSSINDHLIKLFIKSLINRPRSKFNS